LHADVIARDAGFRRTGAQAMAAMLLGIQVPKGQTRSNWGRATLTEGQVHYAALDVLSFSFLSKGDQRFLTAISCVGSAVPLRTRCAAR
jgi:hypothetical protein